VDCPVLVVVLSTSSPRRRSACGELSGVGWSAEGEGGGGEGEGRGRGAGGSMRYTLGAAVGKRKAPISAGRCVTESIWGKMVEFIIQK
jgi:hypothetical protein